jgi:hypothetical protein
MSALERLVIRARGSGRGAWAKVGRTHTAFRLQPTASALATGGGS